MPNRFRTHYTLEEASALLPQVRHWLDRLSTLKRKMERQDERIAAMREQAMDMGGGEVNAAVRTLAEMQGILLEFYQREIQIKDLDRGLIDFPAVIEGKEVFLCWEKCEEEIGYWHSLDSGYTGREPL